MSKKRRTYRGQGRNKNCEDRRYTQIKKEYLKEVTEVNNKCIHTETHFDEDENETYCKECGKCI